MNGNRRFHFASAVVLTAAVATPTMATWNMSFRASNRLYKEIVGPQVFAERNQAGPFTLPPRLLAPFGNSEQLRNAVVPDSTMSISLPYRTPLGRAPRTRSIFTYHDLNVVRGQQREIPIFFNSLPAHGVVFVFDDSDFAFDLLDLRGQRFHVTDGRFDDPRLASIVVYDIGTSQTVSRLPDGTPASPLLRQGWMRFDAKLTINPAPGALGALGLASLLGASRRRR